MSVIAVTIGTGEAPGRPESGQVANPRTASAPSATRRTGRRSPRTGPARMATATSTPSRTRCASPSVFEHLAQIAGRDARRASRRWCTEPATTAPRACWPPRGPVRFGPAAPGRAGKVGCGQPGEEEQRADQQQDARVTDVLGHRHGDLDDRRCRLSSGADGGVEGAPGRVRERGAGHRAPVRRDHPVADEVRTERVVGRPQWIVTTAPLTVGSPSLMRLPSGASTMIRPRTGCTASLKVRISVRGPLTTDPSHRCCARARRGPAPGRLAWRGRR